METTAFQPIYDYIKKHALIPHGSTVILGFSGGPDSLFLLHALAPWHHAGIISLHTAHLDHCWRPTSAQEAEFCIKTAQDLGIQCHVAQLTKLEFSAKFNGSKEEYGRKARRFFFEQCAQQNGASLIALAHHANDQQETFFLRLIRGATLTGLTSIKPRQGNYIHPLLDTEKDTILAYLQAHNISYLIDETNTQEHYLRNRIRAYALPALKRCDNRFDANFSATLARLQETEELLESLTQEFFTKNVRQEQDVLVISLPAFRATHHVLQQRIIMHWLCKAQVPFTPSERFLDEIISFLSRPSGATHQLHQAWQLTKRGRWAHISFSFSPNRLE